MLRGDEERHEQAGDDHQPEVGAKLGIAQHLQRPPQRAVLQVERGARKKHERQDDPLRQVAERFRRTRVRTEAARGQRRKRVADRVVGRDAAHQPEQDHLDHRQAEVEAPEPPGRVPDTWRERVLLYAGGLGKKHLAARDGERREDRHEQDDDPEAAEPLAERAPEQEPRGERGPVPFAEDGGAGAREPGHALEESVNGREALGDERNRAEYRSEQPRQRDGHKRLDTADRVDVSPGAHQARPQRVGHRGADQEPGGGAVVPGDGIDRGGNEEHHRERRSRRPSVWATVWRGPGALRAERLSECAHGSSLAASRRLGPGASTFWGAPHDQHGVNIPLPQTLEKASAVFYANDSTAFWNMRRPSASCLRPTRVQKGWCHGSM